MCYTLKGKLESITYSSDGKVSGIKLVPVGEYTLQLDGEKYCILPNSDKNAAKMLKFNEFICLNLSDKNSGQHWMIGKISVVNFLDNELLSINSDCEKVEIKVGEIQSVEVFA